MTQLYDHFARTESMTATVLRDAQTIPELAALLQGTLVPYLEAVRESLADDWERRGDGRRRLLATLRLAIDFHTWRLLEREDGLSREEAVELMFEAVRSSGNRMEVAEQLGASYLGQTCALPTTPPSCSSGRSARHLLHKKTGTPGEHSSRAQLPGSSGFRRSRWHRAAG